MFTTELVDDVVQENDLHDDDGAFGGDDWDSPPGFKELKFKKP